MMAFEPPPSRRLDLVEDLHGVKTADPYRWLEDIDSPESREWVKAQSSYARQYLDRIAGRAEIEKRLTALSNYTRYGGPRSTAGITKRGGRIFFLKQEGLQNQPVLYVQSTDGQPRELLNPNSLSKDGTAAVAVWEPSRDGKWLCYGISKAGSDWQEWRIRDVESGRDLPDRLDWVKFSTPAWSADSQGIYYSRYPEPDKAAQLTAANYFHKVYYHRLRTAQSADKLIYERPDQKEWLFESHPVSNGRYLVIKVDWGTRVENPVYFQDSRKPGVTQPLVEEFIGAFVPIGSKDSTVFFHTTYKAPKGRVIAVDLEKPARENWREIVPEAADALESALVSAGRVICSYLRDARTGVRIYSLEGKPDHDVTLPGAGTAAWAPNGEEEMEQYYAFSGYTRPATVYRYDVKSRRSEVLFSSKLSFDPDAYETRQVFYNSKDGTRVPMFLTYRKGIKLDGSNPTLLYGYGGFNIALTPDFKPHYIGWLEMGGIFAVANLRGGSEYGDSWHKAGMLHNKQNVFDDFIGAAEYLIANRYTSTPKLAIMGGSNGGLLVGAVLNQRPDLFGAAIPRVGVMDMLRFHKFTIGSAWVSDYGSPDDPRDFAVLRKYSPLHNIRQGTEYPPTLVVTADHDDRVVPSHSFKYAAALQHAQEGKAPILIRIETSAGHGAGKPTAKIIEEEADVLAFLRQSLKM
ncbi:MAG: prolyl oligopeptidase family serine peptidase [Bryobacteraceae bacterium]|nr:prolyl oligopeptidase family serine peptidase [Bryobacteraceae bacterium]